MRITASGGVLINTTNTSRTAAAGVYLGTLGTTTAGNISSTKASSTSGDDTLQVYSTGAGAYRFYVRMDGVVFAILLMNLVNPLIDKIRPKALGKVVENE